MPHSSSEEQAAGESLRGHNNEEGQQQQGSFANRLGIPAAEIIRWALIIGWLIVQLYLQTHYVSLTAYRTDTDRLDARMAKTEALLIALDKGMTSFVIQDRQLLDQSRRIDKLTSDIERLTAVVAELRGRHRDPM